MKKFSLLLAILVSVFSFSYGNTTNGKEVNDYLLLNSGEIIAGDIVNLVAAEDNLTTVERYNLGILDGKRFAKNKGGNFALGVLTGPIGTAIIYHAPDQLPSLKAQNGPNKLIVNDSYYQRGYSKGAKSKSRSKVLAGALGWLGLLIILL